MSDFMVKVRGQAKGPYSAAQLQTQIRRKRLSRQHQVSPDGGVSWMRAGELEELFPTQTVMPSDYDHEAEAVIAQPAAAAPPNPSVEEPSWSYSVLGQQLGPIPESEVRMLIASGGIDGSTLLWQDGMTDWVEVQHIPTFAAAIRSRQGDSRPQQTAASPSAASDTELHWPSLASLVLALTSLTITIPGSLVSLSISGALNETPFSRTPTASGMAFLVLSMLPGLLFAITSVTVGHSAYRHANRDPQKFEGTVYAIMGLVLGYILLMAIACVGIVCLVSLAR